MGYACEVIADSISATGARLTTMVVSFPRIVLAEFNTHRIFSRNAASSRAIPVATMIERIRADPFVPAVWPRHQPGMQGGEPLSEVAAYDCATQWRMALAYVIDRAQDMRARGAHKQHVNRLLEPWMWTTVVVSSTEWGNFFAQRCSPLAQPEIRTIAEMMRAALDQSTPTWTPAGSWHLPFIRDEDRDDCPALGRKLHLAKIAVARCARVSYLNHQGVRSVADDLALYERLRSADPPHLSPFEHVALPGEPGTGNFRGWYQLRHMLRGIEHA